MTAAFSAEEITWKYVFDHPSGASPA